MTSCIESDSKGVRLRLWSILLVILIATATAPGQPLQQLGQIRGIVKGPIGQVLPAVLIVLSEGANNTKIMSAITDANGRYVLANVRYGKYNLVATLPGFKQSELTSLNVTSTATTIDFNLTPQLPSGAEDRLTTGSIGSAEKHAPVFIPAGVQGTIAPSGYSAAASAEDASQITDRVGDLGEQDLSVLTSGEGLTSCLLEGDLQTAARNHPQSFDANHDLGVFYLSHGNLPQSIRYLKLASEARPADANNFRALAIAYIKIKQYADAIEVLQRATQKESSNAALLRLLAIAYQATGDRSRSIAIYLQAATLDASDQNQFLSGIGLIRLAAIDEAARLFISAITTNPGPAKLWTGLGIAQGLQQHKAEAIRSLLHAIDQDREYLPPYSILTSFVGTSTEFDAQIEKRLEALLIAQPESPEAHYNYAVFFWKKRRVGASTSSPANIESQLRFAIAKNPTFARAHFQLGVVYADSGDDANAAKELQEATKLNPGDAEAHYRLAQVYRRDKQAALADTELQKFRDLKRNDTEGSDDLPTDVDGLIPQLIHQTPQVAPCPRANP